MSNSKSKHDAPTIESQGSVSKSSVGAQVQHQSCAQGTFGNFRIVPKTDSGRETVSSMASNNNLTAKLSGLSMEKWPSLDQFDTFKPFPHLPIELRLQIFLIAARTSRFIEIERVGDCHDCCRVCPRSQKVPAILHVNREARDEAMKLFVLRMFGYRCDRTKSRSTYYNPDVDIVLFGQKTCLKTLATIITQSLTPRVAFMPNPQIEVCCKRFTRPPGRIVQADILKVLHGYAESYLTSLGPIETPPILLGGLGLKEVFIVVLSSIWPVIPGEVNPYSEYRRASPAGFELASVGNNELRQSMMKKIRFQEATEYAHLLKWAGGNAPAFKLISLAPPAPPGKVYEVLHLHHHEVRALVRKNHALMREFESQTNCKITISREWKLQPDKEIGLFGYRENVEEAKKVILGRQRS